jgi:hypothetical protein
MQVKGGGGVTIAYIQSALSNGILVAWPWQVAQSK